MESVSTHERLRAASQNRRNCFLNVISNLTFSWVMPILLKGRKEKLTVDDLHETRSDQNSASLNDRLEKCWIKELQNKDKTPSLMRAGLKAFGFSILFRGLLFLIFELTFRVTVPIFLGKIIKTSPESSNPKQNETYLYAMAIILCNFLSVILIHPLNQSNMALGMRIRIAVCAMIYRKALKLSRTALNDTSTGQIVNLLSNDVAR